MTFQQVASSLESFFKSHDLDPALYQVRLTTRSPLALDQLRLALSSDFKYLWAGTDLYPRNHFVGWFTVYGVSFRTAIGEPPDRAPARLPEDRA